MAHAEVDTGKKTPAELKKKNAQQTKTEQMEEKIAEEAQIAQAEVDAGKKTPVDLKKKLAQQTNKEQMEEKIAEEAQITQAEVDTGKKAAEEKSITGRSSYQKRCSKQAS